MVHFPDQQGQTCAGEQQQHKQKMQTKHRSIRILPASVNNDDESIPSSISEIDPLHLLGKFTKQIMRRLR